MTIKTNNDYDYCIDFNEQTKFLTIETYEHYNSLKLIEEVKKDYRCNFNFAVIVDSEYLTLYKENYGITEIELCNLEKRFNIDDEDLLDFEESIIKIIRSIDEYIIENDNYYKVIFEGRL